MAVEPIHPRPLESSPYAGPAPPLGMLQLIHEEAPSLSSGAAGLLRVWLLGVQGGRRSPEQRLQHLAVRVQQRPGALVHPVGHVVVVGRFGQVGRG